MGRNAQSYSSIISGTIVKAPHPSPMSAGLFFSQGPYFSVINEHLEEQQMGRINWKENS
jgi:uracil DNA glycosylase